MSAWGAHAGRKTGCGRPLQFVVPACPPGPEPPSQLLPLTAGADDDVWGEDLPEGALEEVILLESQVLSPSRGRPAQASPEPAVDAGSGVWEDMDLELAVREPEPEPEPEPRAGAERSADSCVPAPGVAELQAKLRRVDEQNVTLAEEAKKARTDRYTQQGEVSVLRAELAKRASEQESQRQESQRRLQQQQEQSQALQLALGKDIDVLKTELQFRTHELSEASRQCRALRSSAHAVDSPPRKQARLTLGSPDPQRGFITRSEFRKAEYPPASRDTVATQTTNSGVPAMNSEPLPCHLVAAVLSAGGGADWLPADAVTCLAALSRQQRLCPDEAAAASQLLARSAGPPLSQYLSLAERLQEAADADRRLCTLSSGRRRAAALLALLRHERTSTAVLAALTRLAEWPGLAAPLLTDRALTELLPRLLRPVIVESEVHNLLMLEYTAALLATAAVTSLPEHLVRCVEPVVNEVLNTKPPSRVLRPVLELLISTAGTGQVSAFWCCTRPTGTCLLKKLCILCSAEPAADSAEPSHPLPTSHSRHRPPPARRPVDTLRGDLRPAELRHWTVTTQPALATSADSQWFRLVALVMSRQAALPSLPCCRGNLTQLVVQLLYQLVTSWEHGGGGDASPVHVLVAALYRLSDLDPAFSASVSRARLHYLVTMDTLGRRWRQMAFSPQLVGVLQELYRFERGTFNGSTQTPS